MVDVDKLSDVELRTKLLEFGFPVMPITGTTRKVMVKKLKMLLENKKKTSSQERRSLARYSSEEESEPEVKVTKKDKSRRATTAATLMQPPSSKLSLRKSVRKNDSEDDSEATTKEIKTVLTRTQTTKITTGGQDEFDTGSESESEFQNRSYLSGNSSFGKENQRSTYTIPISRNYSSPKAAVDPPLPSSPSYTSAYSPSRYSTSYSSQNVDPAERLNQIRSRLSLGNPSYERSPGYSSPPERQNDVGEPPFLSNFTKRLSELSANSPKNDYDYKSDVIKEHDSNGASSFSRSYFSRPLRHRDLTREFQTRQENNIFKNNLVSFTVLGVAFLFFIFVGVMYLGIKNDSSAVDTAGYIIPNCEKPGARLGIDCLADDDIKGAINTFKVLKPELYKRGVNYACSYSTIKPYMNESNIINFIASNYAIKDEQEIRKHLRNLEVLIFTNPAWGLSIVDVDDENADVSDANVIQNMDQVLKKNNVALVVLHPDLPWRCSVYRKVSVMFNVTIFASTIFLFLFLTNYAYKHYKYYQQKQKDELFILLERILKIVQANSTEEGGSGYIVVNHVRDMLLPINERKRMEGTWRKAVQFINENESRVRTEVQVVQGETYEVWRWLGGSSVSPTGSPRTKTWQGQAFETQVGSVNSLPCSPTPCLKIRGMVDDGDRNLITIKEAVLSKCAHQCRILHCAVDTASKCVYLKCADQKDAATAYVNLHGWWYAGHLVTVKYLRSERYMQRFPDSPSGPPYLKAVAPAADWAS